MTLRFTENVEAGRFRDRVTRHVLMQYVRDHEAAFPLIQGIHGPPGSGKTFQLECVLLELGMSIHLMSGSELESINAGEPARLLERRYLNASEDIRAGRFTSSAVVIDDFDTGAGDWGPNEQFTVNRTLVLDKLMNLCDRPNLVDGKHTERVPIFLTGNDFTRIYEPLRRPGRMSLFAWEMLELELAEALQPIFHNLSASECQQLAGAFQGQQIAFFAHVRSMLLAASLDLTAAGDGRTMLLKARANGGLSIRSQFSYEDVVNAGRQLAADVSLSRRFRKPPRSGRGRKLWTL